VKKDMASGRAMPVGDEAEPDRVVKVSSRKSAYLKSPRMIIFSVTPKVTRCLPEEESFLSSTARPML